MTLAVLASRALSGMHAHAVRVETHLGPGLPGFNVVGLVDTEVRESRERVRAAIINSGFEFPAGRITVNLSPADMPKESGRFDLPIALGVLLASGQLAAPAQDGAQAGRQQGGGSGGDSGEQSVDRSAGRSGELPGELPGEHPGKDPDGPSNEPAGDSRGAHASGLAGERRADQPRAPDPALSSLVLAGELSLTGALVPVAAPLVIALSVARDAPAATLILPAGSAE
ncbi:magnesium chelatase domain-containing protein, partial [Achromobacter sp. UBA5777]|uniref:magnesium chelatase domain-containing protein n=1 Tax=Achromobacter sp. UBA5777 TaxID=1945913 RepID=UPI0025B9E870